VAPTPDFLPWCSLPAQLMAMSWRLTKIEQMCVSKGDAPTLGLPAVVQAAGAVDGETSMQARTQLQT